MNLVDMMLEQLKEQAMESGGQSSYAMSPDCPDRLFLSE